jgi:hypothetical protein
MRNLLPDSTNAVYRGSPWSVGFLAFIAVMTIIPGCIHYFVPDGGASEIAGLNLGADRATIIGVFAWMGASQIAFGIAELLVAIRYRSLTALFLLLVLLENSLDAVAMWITKSSPTGHHPPENYGALVIIVLALVSLLLALKSRA